MGEKAISKSAGKRLLASLGNGPSAPDAHAGPPEASPASGSDQPSTVGVASTHTTTPGRAERGADALLHGASSFTQEIGARWSALVTAVDSGAPARHGPRRADSEPPSSDGQTTRGDTTLDASRSVFAHGGHAVVGAGVDALSALDEDGPTEEAQGEARPLGALQVFWFIGVILVLAGSVMGVREAWRTLEGVNRQLVIGAALFVYHVLFVGLARVLIKRSHVTGRVLAGISAGLLPIAFVAVASAVGTKPSVGIPFAAVLVLASVATLSSAGGAFVAATGRPRISLALALVPALLLELPLAAAPTSPGMRLGMPMLALLPVLLSALRVRVAFARGAPARSAVTAIAASSYGAIAVALFAVFGGPSDTALDLSGGTPAQLVTTAWLGLFAAMGWLSSGGMEKSTSHPRAGVLLSLLSLALLVSAALAGAVTALADDPARSAIGLVPCALSALALVIVVLEQRKRLGVLHLVAPLGIITVLLAARVFLPQAPDRMGLSGIAGLPASTVLVAAAMLASSALSSEPRRRTWCAAWGVVSGMIILAVTCGFEATAAPTPTFPSPIIYGPFTATAAVAGALAVSAHAGAGQSRPWLHLHGALSAFACACALVVPARAEAFAESVALVCAGLGMVYGAAAIAYPSFLKNASDPRRPLDDVSLLFAVLGLIVSMAGSQPTGALSTSLADARLLLPRALPVLLVGALLAIRALRDASAVVTFMASVAIAYALRLLCNVGTTAEITFLFGLISLGAGALAALRGDAEPPRFGRAIGGVVPLPLGARGGSLLDGVGMLSVASALIAAAASVQWIAASGPRLGRPGVIFGMLAVVSSALVGFGTRALTRMNARGSVVTLALAGVAIGLTAVGNRVGRPLPPEIVGRNLTVILCFVWLLARGVVRVGPRIAQKLGRPLHGPHYHYVPHAGVLALTLLLLVDAWLVGSPTASRALWVTPPLMLLGGGLGALLLYRSSRLAVALHAGLGSLLGLATVAAAQHALRGPHLLPLDPPGGRWVPAALVQSLAGTSGEWLDPTRFLAPPDTEDALWARALLGTALFVLVSAVLVLGQSRIPALADVVHRALVGRDAEDRHATIQTALSVWACVGAALLGLNLTLVPALPPAALLTVAGVLLVLARGGDKLGSAYRSLVIIMGAPLLVHALAQQGTLVPVWAGPLFATLPLGIALAGSVAARRRERGTLNVTDTELGVATLVAMIYSGCAVAYALATRSQTSPRFAARSVLFSASDAMSTTGIQIAAAPLAVTLVLLAVTAACTATTWRGGLASILGVFPPPILALAGASVAAATMLPGRSFAGMDTGMLLLRGDGPLLAACVSGAAAVAHVTRVVLARLGRGDVGQGLGAGRDLVLLSTLAIVAAFVLGRGDDIAPVAGFRVGPMGVLALGTAIVVSIDAASREKTSRHVMFVETLLVALYAFATRELDIRPELHAILGLGYGFSLLGVAVIARRRNIPQVSVATRRFTAALPIMIAVLTAQSLNDGLALLAFGSSLLYGVMAMVEKSRILGSLAALAANLALLLFALAQGLDGIEIYVGPLGLLVTALSQLFAPRMNAQGRSAARILGGLLLYLPAGLKLTLQLGAASDGSYSVVFGVVCLLGVLAGLVLQVRAYLALGTLFLTLDVIANLVFAGLRDHRVGFVLLSASGLLILGIMITVTLRREAARALLRRIQGRFRAWD
jgi:hypothetical protein